MRNPFAMLPGGRWISAAEAVADFPSQDYGCPRCGQRLQLMVSARNHPGFPRFIHYPHQGNNRCDRLAVRRAGRVERLWAAGHPVDPE
jgi:hypothetical protein